MGIAFATGTESTVKHYSYSDEERNKTPFLGQYDLSGQTIYVPVEPITFDRSGMDPIFSQSKITWKDFERGYRHFTLDPSGLRSAVACLRYREIRVSDARLFASAAGEILVPVEFESLIPQFQRAAGYFTGSYGPLGPDLEIQYTVHRDLIRLPGLPRTVTFPHVDYPNGKKQGYDRPAKIIFLTGDPGGTGCHSDLSLMDVMTYNEGEKQFDSRDIRYLRYLGRMHKPTRAEPGAWIAKTDLHVHEGLLLTSKQVPEEEQFDWEERDRVGNVVDRGKACFRNFLHLCFERK